MTPARLDTLAWLAQRLSAAVLALCLLLHLGGAIYAVRGGLSAAEILARTRGNAAIAAFYGLFVLAISIHGPLGLRAVLIEWTAWRGRSVAWTSAAFGLLLLALGLRAIWALVL